MKNLTLTIEEEISILDKYDLTPNELFLLRVLLLLQDNEEDEHLKRFISILKRNNIQLRDVLVQLQNKEIILKSYKIPKQGEAFDPFSIPINKNFLKNIYKCSFELGKELFEAYPQFGTINGTLVPLRGVSKKFDSLEQAYFKYGKSIGFNPEKHKAIMELVSWAKDNNILNCSLASFIVNNGWHDLQALKDGDAGNINYDAVRIL